MLGSPLNDLSEVFDHKQVLAYDMHRSIKHPTAGSVQVPGRSMNLCEPSTKLDEHLPLLCEYNDQIPGQIGYRPEIDVFREDDVVWCVGYLSDSVSHPSPQIYIRCTPPQEPNQVPAYSMSSSVRLPCDSSPRYRVPRTKTRTVPVFHFYPAYLLL